MNLRGFITHKLEEQTEFVRWWKETVGVNHGAGRGHKNNADPRSFSKDDAESLTGITQQQVSKWAKKLQKPDQYRAQLFGAAYILSANVHRRHLTKGQQAMVTAMAYPNPEKWGGRRDRGQSSKNEDCRQISSGNLSMARYVLRNNFTPEGQQAMVTAMAYPEATDKGGRGIKKETMDLESDVSGRHIRRARFVLRNNLIPEGQQAMVTAMAKPDGEKGGRGKLSQNRESFSKTELNAIAQARFVLRNNLIPEGQQAMVTAMAYPDLKRGNRYSRTSKNEALEVSSGYVSQARYVLRNNFAPEGQQAMAMAMAYPEGRQGRRNDLLNNSTSCDFDKANLSRARFVLRNNLIPEGQQAMVTAMAYPEAAKLRRKGSSVISSGKDKKDDPSEAHISKARFVLRNNLIPEGQQAMAMAMAYPEGRQGKKDTSGLNHEVDMSYVRRARFVLRNNLIPEGQQYPDRCLAVMAGTVLKFPPHARGSTAQI